MKNMKRFFFAAAIASFVFVSCNSGSSGTEATDTINTIDSSMLNNPPDTTNNSIPSGINDTSKPTGTITMPPVSLPASNNSQPSATLPAANVKPVSPQPASTAAGLNPEHGKPGHRC